MEEWSPFIITKFEKDVLDVYLKHDYGFVKMYMIPFFASHLSDETALFTLQEFADKCEVVEW